MKSNALIHTYISTHDDGMRIHGLPMKLMRSLSDIPWGEGRTIEEVLVTKKVGTCTGKHLVLLACLEVLHIPCRPVVCTFRWQDQGLKLPNNLQDILKTTTWKHGHSFLQVQNSKDDWIDLDITWDPALASYGCPSLPTDWDACTSFIGVKKNIDRWNNVSITDKKKELIDQLTPEQRAARSTFMQGFFAWIKSER